MVYANLFKIMGKYLGGRERPLAKNTLQLILPSLLFVPATKGRIKICIAQVKLLIYRLLPYPCCLWEQINRYKRHQKIETSVRLLGVNDQVYLFFADMFKLEITKLTYRNF